VEEIMTTTINASPTQIKRTVQPGGQYEETLTVGNTSQERYNYRIRTQEEYGTWVDPNPDLFAINAQEERAIALSLQPPETAKIGVHRFDITVLNDDVQEDQARIDVALLVPIPLWWWVVIAIIVVLLIIVILRSLP
jgi:hypothetical protein